MIVRDNLYGRNIRSSLKMCASAQLSGIHSRSEELIELTRAYDRGRVEGARTRELIENETRGLVELQRKLGFEYLSDGALYWQDLLRPLARALVGVSSGSRYSRWFDTNTFYLKPVVTGEVSLGETRVTEFVRPDLSTGPSKWKVVLPGPFTFAELADNKGGQSKEDLVLGLAKAEKELIRYLGRSQVSLVQLAEPCLVYQPYREESARTDEIQAGLEALRMLAEGSEVKVSVQTFFGDASRVLGGLVDLPLESVGFDLYATDYEKLEVKSSRPIVLGIVDSRESRVEGPSWIVHTATLVRKHVDAPDWVFSPNSDMKYLPRSVADAKLEALARAASIYWEAS